MHKDIAPESIWYQFYQEQHPPDKLGVDFSPQNTPSFLNSNYFLYQCIFHALTDGCINIERNSPDNPPKYLLSKCYFYDNTKTGRGTCIRCQGGFQIVQHRICAYNCQNNGDYGEYSMTVSQPQSDFLNYIVEGSISHCGSIEPEESRVYIDHVVSLAYGLISISKSNFSKSSSLTGTAFHIFEPTSNESYYSSIRLTNVESNTAAYIVIRFESRGYCQQKMLNYINNTIQRNESYLMGHIRSALDYLQFDCCCFSNNEGIASLFRKDNQGHAVIIADCFIDKLTSQGQLIRTNIITDSSTLILNFFETGYCFNPSPKCKEKTCIYRFSHKYLIDISLSIIINRSD